jgi:hypothetical protein
MKKITSFLALISCLLILSNCKKAEGTGGSSMIKGKVYVKNYNSTGTVLLSEYYGKDVDVYIIYGENSNYFSDKVATSYDGSFEFPYLTKGKYRIFVYEQCYSSATDPCPSGVSEVIVSTEITKNKSTVELADIVIKD